MTEPPHHPFTTFTGFFGHSQTCSQPGSDCVSNFRGSKLVPGGRRRHRKLPPQLHQHPRLTNKRKHSDPRGVRRRTLEGIDLESWGVRRFSKQPYPACHPTQRLC